MRKCYFKNKTAKMCDFTHDLLILYNMKNKYHSFITGHKISGTVERIAMKICKQLPLKSQTLSRKY